MKTLRAIGAALVLALSLSISTYADANPGDIHTPGHSMPVTSEQPAKPGSTVNTTEMDDNPKFPTIVEVLWAFASMY